MIAKEKLVTKWGEGHDVGNCMDYTIRLGIDAHAEQYFTLLHGNYIVAERINSAEDAICFLKEKLYQVVNNK